MQPDAAFTCGMAGFVELAKQFKQAATHSWGAGGGTMQNVHAAFATENATIVELVPSAGPLHTEVYGASLRFVDGRVLPSDCQEKIVTAWGK